MTYTIVMRYKIVDGEQTLFDLEMWLIKSDYPETKGLEYLCLHVHDNDYNLKEYGKWFCDTKTKTDIYTDDTLRIKNLNQWLGGEMFNTCLPHDEAVEFFYQIKAFIDEVLKKYCVTYGFKIIK